VLFAGVEGAGEYGRPCVALAQRFDRGRRDGGRDGQAGFIEIAHGGLVDRARSIHADRGIVHDRESVALNVRVAVIANLY
jgi:hypothetical protein